MQKQRWSKSSLLRLDMMSCIINIKINKRKLSSFSKLKLITTWFLIHSSQIFPRLRRRLKIQRKLLKWPQSPKIIRWISNPKLSLNSMRKIPERKSHSEEERNIKIWMSKSSKDLLQDIRKSLRRHSNPWEEARRTDSIQCLSIQKSYSNLSPIKNKRALLPLVLRASHLPL